MQIRCLSLSLSLSLSLAHTNKHSETEMFNSFLRELKSDLIGTRYSPFWDKVVAGTCTCTNSV